MELISFTPQIITDIFHFIYTKATKHTLRTLLLQKAKCSSKSYESRNIIKLRAVNQSKANLKTIAVILGTDKTSREGGIRSTDGSGTFYRISRYFHCQR